MQWVCGSGPAGHGGLRGGDAAGISGTVLRGRLLFKSKGSGACALRSAVFRPVSFVLESLILAQNERWRHGLGMQVERVGGNSDEWRKGEQYVRNLPSDSGQPRETGINTGCGCSAHAERTKGASRP